MKLPQLMPGHADAGKKAAALSAAALCVCARAAVQDGGAPVRTLELGGRRMETTHATAEGIPVVPMWRMPMPTAARDAGYPVLEDAEHALVWKPRTRAAGAYNHYSALIDFQGRLFAMWANHPYGEDFAGQRVLYAYSDAWGKWSEPQVLFPPPGPVRRRPHRGMHAKPDRWMVIDDRLYAVSLVSPGNRVIAREVYHAGHSGPVFTVVPPEDPTVERPSFMVGVPEPVEAKQQAAAIRDWFPQHHQVSWWGRYANIGQQVPGTGIDDASLIESFSYRAGDGGEVLLVRNWGTPGNPVHNNRMYVSFRRHREEAWSMPYPTDIPDSPSRAQAITLDDGRVLLIGNQIAPHFDAALYLDRDPMTVAVSRNGYDFDRAFVLRLDARTAYRFEGVHHRNHGFAYSSSLTRDGWLYTLYSISKEDIGITRVRLESLE